MGSVGVGDVLRIHHMARLAAKADRVGGLICLEPAPGHDGHEDAAEAEEEPQVAHVVRVGDLDP